MPFILGGVAFTEFEAPERMPFGGGQRLVVQRSTGGRRNVQSMGYDPKPLDWEGRFRGPTAFLRARMLEFKAIAGRPVLLTWDTFIYQVVIEDFQATYEAFYEVSYKISCTVIKDYVAPAASALLANIEDAIMGDLKDALGLSGDNPALAPITAGLQTGIMSFATGGRLSLSALGGAAMAGLQSGAATAFSSSAAVAQFSNGAVTTGSVAGVVAGGNPQAMASAVTGQVATVEQAYRSQGVVSLLGRLRANVGGGAVR